MFFASLGAQARVATGSGGGHFQTHMFDDQKQQQKDGVRWTLADWLAQKNKSSLADQWLALHRSATIFEINASAAHSAFSVKSTDAFGVETKSNSDSQVYQLDIFVTIVNLHGEYEKTSGSEESWAGSAGLLLFGTSSQTTSWLGRYGWRKLNNLETHETWENFFAESELQLYVTRNFGLQGRYRLIFPAESNLSNRLAGHRATGGAFIEFKQFRIYGDCYWEPIELKDASGAVTKQERAGYEAGLKIYF